MCSNETHYLPTIVYQERKIQQSTLNHIKDKHFIGHPIHQKLEKRKD